MEEDSTSRGTLTAADMDRRKFIKVTGAAGLGGLVAGCSGDGNGDTPTTEDGGDEQTPTGTTTGSSDETTTITFSVSFDGEIWENYRDSVYEAGLSDNIELERAEFPSANRGQTWEQWLSTGREDPDIFMVSTTGAPYVERGYLANVSERMSDETETMIWEEMPDPLVQLYTQGDTLYGVPFFMDIGVMQYRKDLVREAGYQPDEEDWATNPLSWEEFSQVMSDTLEETDVEYGFGFGTQGGQLEEANFYEWMASYGGDFFGDVPYSEQVGERECTVDEEPVVNAVKMGRGLIYGEDDQEALSGISRASPEAVLQWNDDPPVNNVEAGDMIATRNWLWSIPTFREAFGDDFGVMPLPYGVPESEAQYEGMGGSRSILTGWYIAINGNTQNPDAATEVLEAIVQDSAVFGLLETQGYSPSKPKIYETDQFQEMDAFGPYADAIQYAANHLADYPALNPHWQREMSFVKEHVMNALTQSATPQAAMDELATTIEDFEDQQV